MRLNSLLAPPSCSPLFLISPKLAAALSPPPAVAGHYIMSIVHKMVNNNFEIFSILVPC